MLAAVAMGGGSSLRSMLFLCWHGSQDKGGGTCLEEKKCVAVAGGIGGGLHWFIYAPASAFTVSWLVSCGRDRERASENEEELPSSKLCIGDQNLVSP